VLPSPPRSRRQRDGQKLGMFRCLGAKPALRALGKRFVSHHVAIIGSGPSAFYAARTIAKRDPSVQIDLIEKLPVPFGKIWISRAAFFG
jgi:NADPH-dependent 2,4-dienoyl-CoA reductase/sulfur reductase-like enzyme